MQCTHSTQQFLPLLCCININNNNNNNNNSNNNSQNVQNFFTTEIGTEQGRRTTEGAKEKEKN
jgi:hypothetical protein